MSELKTTDMELPDIAAKSIDDKSTEIKEFDSFDDTLCEYHDGELLRGIYGYGFDRPSEIQSKTIIPICEGRDLIAQAQSGSGKTGAFGIGALTRVKTELKGPQVIIIGNTRELALQILNVLNELGAHTNIKNCLCVGGTLGNSTMKNLEEARKSHILIGTPGRLNDLINKDKLLVKEIKLLILDEADYLLVRDFIAQIKLITKAIPKDTQICLFSATYPPDVLEMTKYFMHDPVKILIKNEEVSVELIKNYFVNVKYEEYKYDTLVEFYQKLSVCQAVIFVNSINKAEELGNKLKDDGHTVGIIHSKMDDLERREVLKLFRTSRYRILVATDIISRGIDVQQVGLVINYDIPKDSEQYIHRVGRSGRFGKIGVAISLVTDHFQDIKKMQFIEKTYKIDFLPLPSLEIVNTFLTGLNGYSFTELCD